MEMYGNGVRLRTFRTSDVDRIVEACSDPHTAHWLVSMPRPYQRHNALAYLNSIAELAARGAASPGAWLIRRTTAVWDLSAWMVLAGMPSAEIGYWTHPDARGRGVVTEAVRW